MDETWTLERMLGRVVRLGMRFNNLFECEDGLWQCNLRNRDSTQFFDYGKGKTAKLAIVAAVEKCIRKNVVSGIEMSQTGVATAEHQAAHEAAADAVADDDLIG